MWRGLWGLRELHGRAGDDETDDARAEETADGWAGGGGVWATGEFNVNVFFDNCRKFLLRSVAPPHSIELYHNSNQSSSRIACTR